jgi:N-acetylglutamate synthase-like GNAT family acetyltransferase
MPIEIAPWGPVGRDLMALQCLVVKTPMKQRGLGRALVAAAEEETRRQGRKGLVVAAFYHDFWFMPAPFFERCGFAPAARQGTAALLWKVFDLSAEPPAFMEPNYRFQPVPGKVAVDLFWSRSCLTSDTEAQRVREVAAEFGAAVALREFCADDAAVRARYGISRAILVDGEEIGWGYEAPKEGLRDAIRKAMADARPAQP